MMNTNSSQYSEALIDLLNPADLAHWVARINQLSFKQPVLRLDQAQITRQESDCGAAFSFPSPHASFLHFAVVAYLL
jgi:hypothetical protein